MIEQPMTESTPDTNPAAGYHITKAYDKRRKGWWIWAWKGSMILEPGQFTKQLTVALRIVEGLKKAHGITQVIDFKS